ncbi:hypothetical protein GYMLUDRAFT_32862 [Collybiopsis luxurians FD-317 M1]|nr:hypothetical protein GYMLUDRAFT_32862 [Collybiopsis luxurians FD-317 M1]
MIMTRPRQSLLAQFDPLLAETEPEYVSDSEEEFDPNKENVAPELNDLSMTAFFNRTYKREYAQPAALTKRLVDVGDVTITENIDEEEEEQERVDAASENVFFSAETPKRTDTEMSISRSIARTPLAEITLEHRALPSSAPKKLVDSPSPMQPRRANSSLNSLVDSVNRAGKSFGSLQAAPRIIFNPSDTQNEASTSLLATTAPFSLQASTSSQRDAVEFPASSLLAPPFSQSEQSNRLSLDLHSSFSLQLQSDTSFDLLNDRISFFDAQGSGINSFLNELDDDGDAESLPDETPNTPLASLKTDDTTPTDVIQNVQSGDCGSSLSITDQFKKLSLSSQPQNQSSLQLSPLIFGPLTKQPTSMVTPAFHRTATTSAPALPVIKRTKRYDDERSSSLASNTSSSSSNSADAISQRKPSPSTNVSAEASGPQPFSKGSTRHEIATRPPNAEHLKSVPAPVGKGLPKPSATSGSSGPRRILLSDAQKFTKSAAAVVAPGRHKIPLPTLVPMKSTSATVSGVPRQPNVSQIPPASKLPAPSGIARFGRKATAPTIGDASGSRMPPLRGATRR